MGVNTYTPETPDAERMPSRRLLSDYSRRLQDVQPGGYLGLSIPYVSHSVGYYAVRLLNDLLDLNSLNQTQP